MADRRLQVFHAVAKHLSFTKAAEALFMTQPAVTFQIRQLEDELGTQLVERTNRRVRLTEAGEVFLARAARILEQIDQAEALLKPKGLALDYPAFAGAWRGEYQGAMEEVRAGRIAFCKLDVLLDLRASQLAYPPRVIFSRRRRTPSVSASGRGGHPGT